MAEAKKNDKAASATRYLVQQRKEFEGQELPGKDGPTITQRAWVDLDTLGAVNARKAIEQAMSEYGLSEGDFRAIPEASARVYSPRVQTKTVWGS